MSMVVHCADCGDLAPITMYYGQWLCPRCLKRANDAAEADEAYDIRRENGIR